MGAGGDNLYDNQYTDWSSRIVDGAYPYEIAKAVGCCNIEDSLLVDDSNYWPLCFPSQTLSGVLDLLGIEDNYFDAEFVHNGKDTTWHYHWEMVPYFGCEESEANPDKIIGSAGNIREIAEKASLITIGIGMGDTFNRPARLVQMCLEDESLSSAERTIKAASTAVSKIYEGFNYWKNNYPKLLQYLKDVNPNATIVLVSAINVIADVELFEGALLPVGSVLTAVTASMNCCLEKWAKEYKCIYVDVSNTESRATQCDWAIDSILNDFEAFGAHPTPDGYAYMTRAILNALPKEVPTAPAAVTTNITVDLARFTKLDSVLLDGIAVCDYDLDGTVLTVPCRHKLAKTLTVAVKNQNGGVDFVTYLLSWHCDTGYTAYRLYGKNAVLPVTTKVADTVQSFVNVTAGAAVKTVKTILFSVLSYLK